MDRRTLLGSVGGITSLLFAGCNEGGSDGDGGDELDTNHPTRDEPGEEVDADSQEPTDRGETDDSFSSPHLPGTLIVRLTGEIPENASVLDPQEDSLVENWHLEHVLDVAVDNYEANLEDDASDSDERVPDGTELTRRSVYGDDPAGSHREVDRIEATLGPDRAVDGKWYVEHRETRVTITLRYPPE
ncbi:hypothetical protein [Natrarchaeobius chitinivorans]|uniref:Uncharacterized protein n=1 Tax=Natrarchaeobius chitinivorans TaxID=1679083 RepID=A0A3N6M2G3_NATCH|nr:hypothetical protein [Natrarchaeobius chitinivorans]RQG94584.1 hypothetical protein EA473_10880 [Natrarchaeobius chitinivorans]